MNFPNWLNGNGRQPAPWLPMLLLSTIRDDLVRPRSLRETFLGQLTSWGGYNPSHIQFADPPVSVLPPSRIDLFEAATVRHPNTVKGKCNTQRGTASAQPRQSFRQSRLWHLHALPPACGKMCCVRKSGW